MVMSFVAWTGAELRASPQQLQWVEPRQALSGSVGCRVIASTVSEGSGRRISQVEGYEPPIG